MKVRFSAQATRDLSAIANWIAADRPNAAMKIIHRLRAACVALGGRPYAYTLIEGREEREMRRAPHGRYVICYRVKADGVLILRILDGARDIPSLL